MHVLIVPDSFKNCLSSIKVGEALAQGVLRVFPDATIEKLPVADGGEGTVDAFIAASNGTKIACKAHDALGRIIDSFYGLLPDGTVVIEMAAASGIELLQPHEKNPMLTSTFGTGELIKAAIISGAKDIILALGGSATNDGGTGMAKALGFRFLNSMGDEIPEGGGALCDIVKIDTTNVISELKQVTFQIACDVQNPLVGDRGASAVYGPQKGASAEMVKELDANLTNLAAVIQVDLKVDVANVPGAGAAGGMGAGALAFLKGTLIQGFTIVSEVLDLPGKVAMADVILTGEGMIDTQTMNGKTPFSVAQLVKGTSKKVIAFAGTLGNGYEKLYQQGFTSIIPIAEKPMSLEESMEQAAVLLQNASERVFRLLK